MGLMQIIYMRNLDIDFGRMGNRMFQMAYIYAQVKRGEIPDIFIQDYTLWEEYAEEIKKLYGEGIGMLPYTGIHLRVGKNPINSNEPAYKDNPFYTSIAYTGYYIKALEYFPGGKFIVFSDDIEFAKTYFEGDRFAFDDSEDDIQAFNKLASCQNQILTNSSYSWWAGFLNQNEGRVITIPEESSWFADKIPRVKLPSEWIRINP